MSEVVLKQAFIFDQAVITIIKFDFVWKILLENVLARAINDLIYDDLVDNGISSSQLFRR